MKLISWNVRGLGGSAKRRYVREVLRKNDVDMAMLQETKLEEWPKSWLANLWGTDNFESVFAPSISASGGILVMWEVSKFNLEQVEVERNFIVMRGRWLQDDMTCGIVVVYALSELDGQQAVWAAILDKIRDQ
ncbi:hypothetical protein HRI_003987600 [Hibiscus trionum]|uniref:Endonuclease/exonuclease/phosphatase domain-containing protein n=1 Tax=Hibiscus trionum TaxID=183268 RepID=A0A9W7IXR0_HIBTR|nr:hypothetical protein HRI_003987600 [Hibiscus trionum]